MPTALIVLSGFLAGLKSSVTKCIEPLALLLLSTTDGSPLNLSNSKIFVWTVEY